MLHPRDSVAHNRAMEIADLKKKEVLPTKVVELNVKCDSQFIQGSLCCRERKIASQEIKPNYETQ